MRVEKKRKEREEKKLKMNQIPKEIVSDDDDVHYYREQATNNW